MTSTENIDIFTTLASAEGNEKGKRRRTKFSVPKTRQGREQGLNNKSNRVDQIKHPDSKEEQQQEEQDTRIPLQLFFGFPRTFCHNKVFIKCPLPIIPHLNGPNRDTSSI